MHIGKYICHGEERRMEFEEQERQETARESGKGTAMIASRFRSLCLGISSLLLLSLVFLFPRKAFSSINIFLTVLLSSIVEVLVFDNKDVAKIRPSDIMHIRNAN